MSAEKGSLPSRRFLETYSSVPAASTDGYSVRRYEQVLLGTWNVILLVDRPQEAVSGEELDRAAQDAFGLMMRLEEELSKFQPESEISLLNAMASGRPVSVSERLFSLLEFSKEYWRISHGAFDPTVGPLMRAWGFDDGRGRIPDDEEIEAMLQACGMGHVVLDPKNNTVFFDRPGVSIDLGAIGKGYIVDRAVDRLKELGVHSGAFLSGRSSIVVWGNPPNGEWWRVAVAHPQDPDEVLLELAVSDGAVSTSAAYERRFELAGKEYGHVLDPRTGRPVSGCLGVTVWTPEALVGDVVSTALFVLGGEEGGVILGELGPATVVLLQADCSVWGGIRWDLLQEGNPGFEILTASEIGSRKVQTEPKKY